MIHSRVGPYRMPRRLTLTLSCLLACTPVPAPKAGPLATPPSHPGCFLLLDLETGAAQVLEAQSCDLPTSPASTFKIPNSLIGLETGVTSGADAVRQFDPEKHGYAEWGREDLTLEQAVRQSVLWYFRELAADVGPERMQQMLDRLDYGNRKIGEDVTLFWINHTLTITAHQQLDFLHRMWTGKLDVAPEHVRTLEGILEQPLSSLRDRVREPETYEAAWRSGVKAQFKTGTNDYGDGSVTWLVGRLQSDERDVIFVSRVISDIPPSKISPATEAALRELIRLGLL